MNFLVQKFSGFKIDKRETIAFIRDYAFLLIPALFLFVYNVLRAVYVPLTFDESFALIHFVFPPNLLFVDHEIIAQNHLINTFCTFLCYHLLGPAKVLVRLPNVIAFGVYLYYNMRLSKGVFETNKWAAFCTFVLLCFNPLLIDCFALVKGIGISLALMMAAIYYLWRYLGDKQYADFKTSILCAGFCTINYFGMAYFYVAINLILLGLAVSYSQTPIRFLKRSILLNLPFVLFLCLAYYFILQSPLATKDLEWGGYYIGYWPAIQRFIIDAFFYGKQYSLYQFQVGYILFASVIVAAVLFLFYFRKDRNKSYLFSLLIYSMWVLISGFNIIHVRFFHAAYLSFFLISFLFPLLFLIMGIVFFHLSKLNHFLGAAVMVVTCFLWLIHFSLCANVSYNFYSQGEIDNDKIWNLIHQEAIRKAPKTLDVLVDYLPAPTLQYDVVSSGSKNIIVHQLIDSLIRDYSVLYSDTFVTPKTDLSSHVVKLQQLDKYDLIWLSDITTVRLEKWHIDTVYYFPPLHNCLIKIKR